MPLTTRLTTRFGLEHPIIQAPMAFAAGGALAAAVSNAGGLGLIGGGYGDADWLETQFRASGNARVGCGFITWKTLETPGVVAAALAHAPRALFLSFGDGATFAAQAQAAGVPVIIQVQTVADAHQAVELRADVIVAQGAEAGGHGEKRATMTLVPEVVDLISAAAPDTLVCAAGGIADGRGLAAALALGADGVVVGSRFWAASEALVHPNLHDAAIKADGDATLRQSVTDIARGYAWPARFNIRVVRNAYVDRWLGREDEMRAAGATEREHYAAGTQAGDVDISPAIAGEAVGLIGDIQPAAAIVSAMVEEAEAVIRKSMRHVTP